MTARHRKRHKKEWSPTGAARAAWEARIATVRHLQDALIARVWHVGKLQRAYQFQLASVGHPGAATALLYGFSRELHQTGESTADLRQLSPSNPRRLSWA